MTKAIRDYSRGWNDGIYVGLILGVLITFVSFLAIWVAGWIR